MVIGGCSTLLIHYHIFKNAGTTVDWALAGNFGEGFARLDSDDRSGILRPEDLFEFVERHPKVRAISSHTLPPPKPDVAQFLFLDLILIRNPLDRLMSTYEFYRRTEFDNDPLSVMARRFKPAQFFSFLIESHPHLVNNGQVNYLNGGRRICRESDLKRAIRVIENCSVSGVTELFDVFMVTAEQTLQAHFGPLDFSYLAQNVTPGRAPDLNGRLERIKEECGTEAYERLRKLNRMDLDLFEVVTERAHHKFEGIPDHQRHMLNFKERCRNRISKRTTPNIVSSDARRRK